MKMRMAAILTAAITHIITATMDSAFATLALAAGGSTISTTPDTAFFCPILSDAGTQCACDIDAIDTHGGIIDIASNVGVISAVTAMKASGRIISAIQGTKDKAERSRSPNARS